MKKVVPHRQLCMGCGLCEVACSTAHSESGDVVIACKEEKVASRKTVHRKGTEFLPMSCRHCASPSCVTACISGALVKDPDTGKTEYDQERCVGCYSCVMVCPYGAIEFTDGEAAKCDLCAHRGRPACVDACPNRALTFEER